MTQVSLYCTIDKTAHRLDGVWSSISWSGDSSEVHRTLEFTLENTVNGITKKLGIPLGSKVRMKRTSDKAELFRGYVFKYSINTDGTCTYTCHDDAFYLTRSQARLTYRNKTASQIFRDICKRYGLPVGSVADTKKKFDKLSFRGADLDKIITTALTETRQAGGKKYRVEASQGKLHLREVSTVKIGYKLSTKTNIIDGSYDISNEDRKTVVKLSGGSDEAKPTITATVRSKNASKYGMLSYYAHKSGFKKKSKLKTLAAQLLASKDVSKSNFSVDVIGNVGFRSGRRLHVTEPMSARKGLYYIADDDHSFGADGSHKTSLSLTKSVELAYENYSPPSESTAKKAKADKEVNYVTATGKFTTANYSSGWKATAYNYRMGGINGSKAGITASGTKVDEPRTIAVDPNVIPLGSVVAVWTSTKGISKYSGLYLAEDTGGAIKGKKIDVAMKTASECKTWGKRTVSVAIIERGKGRADARSKAKNWNAVKLRIESKMKAKSASNAKKSSAGTLVTGKAAKVVTLIKKLASQSPYYYKWGGRSVPGLDCSGFVSKVFASVGVSVSGNTVSMATQGRYVTKAQIQAGDLVIFKGTNPARGANGISHIGIAISKTQMIHMSGKAGTKGPKTVSFTSGYWAGKYHSARRVL